MTFGQAAVIGILFSNDIKALHWHATGDDFDKIHNISEELYLELIEEVDDLAEMAIATGEKMPNLSDPNNFLDWKPFSEDFCNWQIFVETLQSKGMEYLNALYDLINSDIKNGYKSVIEEFCSFWEKEISYKNSARMFQAEETKNEADYRDIVVDQINSEEESREELGISDEVVDMFTYNDAYANNVGFNGYDTESKLEPMTDTMIVSGGEEIEQENSTENEEKNEE